MTMLKFQINSLTIHNIDLNIQNKRYCSRIFFLENEVKKLKYHVENLENIISKLKSSKFYKLWRVYNKVINN